jgi:hypothetical protein
MGAPWSGWRFVDVFCPSGPGLSVEGDLPGERYRLAICPSCRSSGSPAVARAILDAFAATEDRGDDVS